LGFAKNSAVLGFVLQNRIIIGENLCRLVIFIAKNLMKIDAFSALTRADSRG
jgi:hypothetical protein